MLVSKEMAVSTIKLVTGDEIICQVVGRDGANVLIKNPLLIILDHYPEVVTDANGNAISDENGVPRTREVTRVVFAPFLLGGDLSAEMRIANQHVITIASPKNDVKTQYSNIVRDL